MSKHSVVIQKFDSKRSRVIIYERKFMVFPVEKVRDIVNNKFVEKYIAAKVK
jgi:hypothetical protein